VPRRFSIVIVHRNGAQVLQGVSRRGHSTSWASASGAARAPAIAGLAAVESVIGACMAVRASAVQEAASLDNDFFFNFEETGWCHRRRSQLSVRRVPRIAINALVPALLVGMIGVARSPQRQAPCRGPLARVAGNLDSCGIDQYC
jgi:hypothetical protein